MKDKDAVFIYLFMQFYYLLRILWTPVYTHLQVRAHGSAGPLKGSGEYKEKQLCPVLLVSLWAV